MFSKKNSIVIYRQGDYRDITFFILNIAPVVSVALLAGLCGLTATSAVPDISEIIQFLDHDNSSYILQLNKEKSRDLQKLLKYFNGTKTSVSNLLSSAGVLPMIFVLDSKYLLAVVLLLFI